MAVAAHCFPILVFSVTQLEAAVAKFAYVGITRGCQLQPIQNAAVISSVFLVASDETQLRLQGAAVVEFKLVTANAFCSFCADDVDLLLPLH